jgi:diguanylate cyclase (GGDEF)-like protein
LGALALAVVTLRDRIDSRAEAASSHAVATRLEQLGEQLGDTLLRFAHWDEAHQAAMQQDVAWLYDNIAINADRGTGFDMITLFGGPFRGPLTWETGGGFVAQRGPLGEGLRAALREGILQLPLARDSAFTGLIEVNGRLHLFAAALLRPADGVVASRLPRDQLAVIVGMRAVGRAEVRQIEAALALSDLQFGAEGQAGRTALTLTRFDGVPLGMLAWQNSRPGTEVIAMLWPIFVAVAVGIAVLSFLIAALARGNLLRLLEGQRAARAEALRDSLTDLPNRLALTKHIAELDECDEPASPAAAVLYMDLNGFKRVNDQLGHRSGDELLRQVADRMRRSCVGSVFLARVGGDEFAAVLAGVDGASMAQDLARRMIQTGAEPYHVDERRITVRLSVGLATRHGDDPDLGELVRRADLAMLRAKRSQRDEPCIYTPEIEAISARSGKIEQAMRQALASATEFRVLYQPIVCAATGRLLRAEALARWTSPRLGEVGPQTFIPLAEASGLIVPLGARIMDMVVADLATVPGLSVSVNISPQQLDCQSFLQDVCTSLAAHGISSARCELELTEAVLITDTDVTAHRLDALHEAGFSTALDDFGTGYSSLGYLRKLPFKTLKIDRSFLLSRARGQSTGAEALIAAMIRLGQALGQRVVCEGVETAEEATFLAALGCDMLQGYHFGRPMSLPDLVAAFPDLRQDRERAA